MITTTRALAVAALAGAAVLGLATSASADSVNNDGVFNNTVSHASTSKVLYRPSADNTADADARSTTATSSTDSGPAGR